MAIATKDRFTLDEFDHEMAEADRLVAELPIAVDRHAEITEAMYDGVRSNFMRQATATDEAWAPHAPLTIALYGIHPILILSSDMFNASTSTGAKGNYLNVTDRAIVIGVDLFYAAQQQFGDASKNIPARPFFDLPEDSIAAVEDIAFDYFSHEVVG